MNDTDLKALLIQEFNKLNKRLDGFDSRLDTLENGQNRIREAIDDLRQEVRASDTVSRAEFNDTFKKLSDLIIRVEELERAK